MRPPVKSLKIMSALVCAARLLGLVVLEEQEPNPPRRVVCWSARSEPSDDIFRLGSESVRAQPQILIATKSMQKSSSCEKLFALSLGLMILTGCQAASSRQPEPIPASRLTKAYQDSASDARRKYDGTEITVKGLTMITPMMPPTLDEQGLVFLEDNGANPARRVACWFSNDQAAQFAKIKGGQLIIVRGIFNGEAGAELKFCRLVSVE